MCRLTVLHYIVLYSAVSQFPWQKILSSYNENLRNVELSSSFRTAGIGIYGGETTACSPLLLVILLLFYCGREQFLPGLVCNNQKCNPEQYNASLVFCSQYALIRRSSRPRSRNTHIYVFSSLCLLPVDSILCNGFGNKGNYNRKRDKVQQHGKFRTCGGGWAINFKGD